MVPCEAAMSSRVLAPVRGEGSAFPRFLVKPALRQVGPGRIVPADKCYPLGSSPGFDLFFAPNRIPHISERLKVNQAVNPVLARRAWNQAFLMLTDSPFQAIRHSRVQVPRAAGKDIDVVGLASIHMQIPRRQGGQGFGMTKRASNPACRAVSVSITKRCIDVRLGGIINNLYPNGF
jgi:hypothetical protein